MPEQDDSARPARTPLLSRRAVLGGLAAAYAGPWLLQGLPARAAVVAAPGAGPLPRARHTATLVGNNQVLVAGGVSENGEPLDDVILYGPGGVTQLAPLNTPRYAHAAVLLSYGQVLVLGGYGQGPLDAAEIYNPTNNTWAPARPLLLPRYNHTAVRATAGQVLVVGGSFQGLLSDTETYAL